jgi:TP901 family phage tail tape measure protein
MQQMTKLAMDMGAKTKYSALEAGQGIEELLKAGLTPAAVQAGGLEAALNLATAGGLDLASASEIMSTALNAFKDDGLKASQVSDILAGAALASATDVMDLKFSLSQVSAVASGVGMSFKDTNIALGLFANNGLKGSDAGTSLKTMLGNLQPKTKAQIGLFHKLGLDVGKTGNAFYDASGNLKSLDQMAGLLHNSMKDMTNQQRSAALETLFGSDAVRAGTILYKEGAEGVKKFTGEMSKVTALDVANEKMNNAAGAVEVLKGALETFQIQVMTPLLPVIKDAGLQFSNWMSSIKPEQVNAWGEKIKDAGQKVLDFANFIRNNWVPIRETVIALTGAVLTLRGGLLALSIVATITKLMRAYREGTIAATLAEMGFNAALLANPLTWVVVGIAALVGVIIFLARNWDMVKEKTRQFWDKLGAFKGVATVVLGPLGLIIRAAVTMAEQWDSTKGVWENVWNGIKIAASNAVNDVIGSINGMIRVINKIPGVNIPIVPKVHWGTTLAEKGNIASSTGSSRLRGALPSHAGGLERVPYDGYVARLHKNERVLTSTEAKGFNGKGGSLTVNGGIHLHGVGGDIESAADKFLEIIATKIHIAGEAGA